jgi:hypothetical protein
MRITGCCGSTAHAGARLPGSSCLASYAMLKTLLDRPFASMHPVHVLTHPASCRSGCVL